MSDNDEIIIASFQELITRAAQGAFTEEEFIHLFELNQKAEKKKARRAAQTKWMREYRRRGGHE